MRDNRTEPFRRLAVLALLVGGAASCERVGSETPTDSPAPPAALPVKRSPDTGSLASLVEAAHRPALGEVQARLAKVLSVTRMTEAPDTPITWKTPSCELRYRFQSDTTIAMLEEGKVPPGPGMGLRMAGEAFMQSTPGPHTIIRNGDFEISHVTDGVKRPGSTQPAGSLAEIRLQRDGRQWSEVDGPTALWSAMGSSPGLVEFWPALPPATKPGSATPWTLTVHGRGDGFGVETTRGTMKAPKGMAIPEPSPRHHAADVELQGWLSVGGEPAAVLVASWMDEVKDEPTHEALADMDVQYSIRSSSRFVVLGNGRLLWAEVDRTMDVSMNTGGDERMQQRHDSRSTIELIEACDGPVLDAPPPEPSAEEATLAAIARLRLAVVNNEASEIVRDLAPEVVAAHGQDAIVALLRRYLARHGVLSFGYLELADEIRRDGNRIRIRVEASSEYLHGDPQLELVAHAELRDGRPVLVSFGTDKVERDEEWQILEVSADRLVFGEMK